MIEIIRNATIRLVPVLFFAIFMLSCEEDDTSGIDPSVAVESISVTGVDELGDRFSDPGPGAMENDSVILLGRNLDQVTQLVLLDGATEIDIPFTNDAIRIYFKVPELGDGATYDVKTLVMTLSNGATVEKDFELLETFPVLETIALPGGFEEKLFTDFDGEGLSDTIKDNDQWSCFGANDDGRSGIGDTKRFAGGGNYFQVTWNGSTDPNFIGCSHPELEAEAITKQTDPEKVTFVFAVNPDGAVGGLLEVQIKDIQGNDFTGRFVLEQDGWQEVSIKLSDLGEQFNFEATDGAKIVPTQIQRITFGYPVLNTPDPSRALIDNLRFHIDPSIVSAPERIAVPAGFNAVNYTNFDGSGILPEVANENWECAGDVDGDNSGVMEKGGYQGGDNYYQVTLDGTVTGGAAGCQPDDIPVQAITRQRDPSKVMAVFAASPDENVGTLFEMTLTDQADNAFTAQVELEEAGWKEFMIPLSGFSAADETDDSMIDPTQIKSMTLGVVESEAGIASTVHVDDIRFYIDTTVSNLEAQELLLTDFDDGGLPSAQGAQWGCFGAIADSGVSDVDGIDGNYYIVNWAGVTTPNFVGCQPNAVLPAEFITETDASKVTMVFDATPSGDVGTSVGVTFRNSDTSSDPNGQAFSFNIELDEDEWQEFSIPLADFGKGFGQNDQSEDVDPSDIQRLSINIGQNNSPNPATIHIDNIRFIIE